jgi:hypothetical protein
METKSNCNANSQLIGSKTLPNLQDAHRWAVRLLDINRRLTMADRKFQIELSGLRFPAIVRLPTECLPADLLKLGESLHFPW